ncbi:hypothetical protein KBA27_00850 [bacterium]|nr:hypothetical protein [bacterium]
MISIINFFRKQNKCTHEKIPPEVECGYCPDCGEFVENQWFITRCKCCGIKVKATIKNGKIVPEKKYCRNCGSEQYVVERLSKITSFDLYFAVLIREVVNQRPVSYIQTWVEEKEEIVHKFITDKRLINY